MTKYWIKIAVGALLIFAVGMGIRYGFNQGKEKVVAVLQSDSPISVPLKFAGFRVDGQRVGQLERLTLERSDPHHVSSVTLVVRVDSAAVAERLRSCILRLDNLEHIDENTSFVCMTGSAADSAAGFGAFESFGEVTVDGTDVVMQLQLPATVVTQLRDRGWQQMDSLDAVPPPTPEAPSPPAPAGAAATSPGGASVTTTP